MTGRTWIKGVAGMSVVLSLVVAWLAGSAEQWLVYGVALLLTAFVPGLVMMRQARARTA
jgi:low temperature requirement protein LtrA